ncbi:YqcI/YcgG family protein, partial [Halobacterium bonnevillei]|uniref:YqcI/YcgG family protein n=1 Tax=Halobacterium bonnevillei TaxID=2692200 RepID=UPI001F16C11B
YLDVFEAHGDRVSFAVFFKPPAGTLTEAEWHERFWHVLQFLHSRGERSRQGRQAGDDCTRRPGVRLRLTHSRDRSRSHRARIANVLTRQLAGGERLRRRRTPRRFESAFN